MPCGLECHARYASVRRRKGETYARRREEILGGRKAKGIPYISISLSLSSFDRFYLRLDYTDFFHRSFLELHIDLKSNMETTNTWANVLLTRARFYDCKKCPIKFISFFFLSNLFIYLGVWEYGTIVVSSSMDNFSVWKMGGKFFLDLFVWTWWQVRENGTIRGSD